MSCTLLPLLVSEIVKPMHSSAFIFQLLKMISLFNGFSKNQWPFCIKINSSYRLVTKYRYAVLEGDIKMRCRSLLIQICEAEDVQIRKGVVSKDHVHMHIEYRPSQDISSIVKLLRGRSSRKLQMEFPD